ncbi:hypothetical protein B0T10DRAFT_502278 [Thelonectria olida]|uniref:Transmembrane protein n=1 Tax=Thelonectria olida TaxID=1576542 RepID=A0A9P8VR16_9HYPO|nr:hypothetical protein B0T10DRAFT_502278 [Thelonectria olida]
MLVSRYTQDRPGNWFIDGDGTCGSTPDSVITSKGAFVGFFVLTIFLAAVAGALNFISLIKKAEQEELFKHGVYKQTVIDVIASVITPILAATLFKQDEDTYTKHNFHVIAWVVLFGFRPGAMMGLLQIFGDELNSAAAAGQMIADMVFPIVGCVVALASENGSVVPVAYGRYRATIFVGVVFLLLHIVMLLIIYLISRGDSHYHNPYRVLTSRWGRVYVFSLGILSIVGSSVLLIVGSRMCGKLTSFIDAMCQLLQAVLSAFLAFYESKR